MLQLTGAHTTVEQFKDSSTMHNDDNMISMKIRNPARHDNSPSEKNMRYECSRKPEKCPACGFANIAEILYGLPAFSPELEKDLNDGRIALGGCEITGDEPVWKCVACQTVVYRKRIGVRRRRNAPE